MIMKAIDILNEVTADVFNLMNLEPFGYAGEYQNEAYDFFEKNYQEEIYGWNEESWCDVMVDSDGKTYAVLANDNLEGYASFAYIEVEM